MRQVSVLYNNALFWWRHLATYCLSYSLFYFALRVWRRNFSFLSEVDDNFLLVELAMFTLTSLLFALNLKLKERRINDLFAQGTLAIFLAISNSVYHNLYAYLMAPHVSYFPFDASYFFAYLAVGCAGGLVSFLILKTGTWLYEKYRFRD